MDRNHDQNMSKEYPKSYLSHGGTMAFIIQIMDIWRFPEMGVPPVIIHFRLEFSIVNNPFSGYPHLWKPSYRNLALKPMATRGLPNQTMWLHRFKLQSLPV